MEEAILSFLAEFKDQPDNWPSVGVIGICGPVNNNTVKVTLCPHWAEVSGDHLQTACNIDKFVFVNDFAAAGHGICKLDPAHYHQLNEN